jgi:hypothetical protein
MRGRHLDSSCNAVFTICLVFARAADESLSQSIRFHLEFLGGRRAVLCRTSRLFPEQPRGKTVFAAAFPLVALMVAIKE